MQVWERGCHKGNTSREGIIRISVYLHSQHDHAVSQQIVDLLFKYLTRALGKSIFGWHQGVIPTSHWNVQMVFLGLGFKGGLDNDDENVIFHFSHFAAPSHNICFLWLRQRLKNEDEKNEKNWAQCMALYLCSQEISPQPTESSICQSGFTLDKNDFVVHHCLKSARNVINLNKSWKQSLYLEAVTVTNCKATGS